MQLTARATHSVRTALALAVGECEVTFGGRGYKTELCTRPFIVR